jgi:hypothetical protein
MNRYNSVLFVQCFNELIVFLLKPKLFVNLITFITFSASDHFS